MGREPFQRGGPAPFDARALAARGANGAKSARHGSADLGSGWGDVVVSPDGRRVFVNAIHADALVVLDAASGDVEWVFEFASGDRPVHLYNPNHEEESGPTSMERGRSSS